MSEEPELYHKTKELRFVLRSDPAGMLSGRAYLQEKVLQQAWISQRNGKVKWVDVPVVDEENA